MTLKEYKEKRMKVPAFEQAYVDVQSEINIIRTLLDAQTSQNSTQKELSERTCNMTEKNSEI